MKLYFSKDTDNEIVVKMSSSIVIEDFSYAEMIKNLLRDNKFDDTDYSSDLSKDEKERIKSMLNRINASIETEEEIT